MKSKSTTSKPHIVSLVKDEGIETVLDFQELDGDLKNIRLVKSSCGRATFIRSKIESGDYHIEVNVNSDMLRTQSFTLDDVCNISKMDSPEDLPNIERVELVTNNFSCSLCGSNKEYVHRFQSKEGMFTLSFHSECLEKIAEQAIELIEDNSTKMCIGSL